MQRAGRLTLLLLLLVGPACSKATHDLGDVVVDDAPPVTVAEVGDTQEQVEREPPADELPPRETDDPARSPDPGTHALVRAVQSRLVAIGFAPGYPDGALGARTRIALKEFQRSHGLPETGDADAATLEALFDREEPGAPDGEIQRTRGEDEIGATPPGRPRLPRVRSFGFGAGVGFLCAAAIAAMGFASRRRKV